VRLSRDVAGSRIPGMTPFTIVALVLVLAAAGPASAQVTDDTWLNGARRDAPVRMRLLSGERLSGVVHQVFADAVDVSTPVGPRTIPRAAIVDVRQRQDDSVANGAVIGATIGAGLLLGIIAALSPVLDCDGCAGQVAGATALYAGAGAGLGALVDAAIRRDEVVYAAPRVAPVALVGPARAGAALRVRF
jgi:hypothetical protein